jgi:hypothetical protein
MKLQGKEYRRVKMEENLNNDNINGLPKQTFSALLIRECFFSTVVALV